MRRRLCDKYHNLMSWLIFLFSILNISEDKEITLRRLCKNIDFGFIGIFAILNSVNAENLISAFIRIDFGQSYG